MEKQTIRVIVADDHPIVLEGLQALLAQAPQIQTVGTARSFDQVTTLVGQVEADVLILDLGGMGGSYFALINRLRREHPELAILVFSTNLDLAPELLDAGAKGYVTKEELVAELIDAISTVARGETFLSPIVREFLEYTQLDTPLTPKERIALKLLAQGNTTLEIAEQMGIDPRSVQNHITTLRRKTGCVQRTQLVDWYRRSQGGA